MPNHPLTEIKRRHKSGEAHRLQQIVSPEYPIGESAAYVKATVSGGLTIGRGKFRITLSAKESAELIGIAQELTNPVSPRAVSPAKAGLMRYPVIQ